MANMSSRRNIFIVFIAALVLMGGVGLLSQLPDFTPASPMPTLMPAPDVSIASSVDGSMSGDAVVDMDTGDSRADSTDNPGIAEVTPESQPELDTSILSDDDEVEPDTNLLADVQPMIISSLPEPDRIVIAFAPDSSAAEREAYLTDTGATVIQTLPQLNSVVIAAPQEITELPAASIVTIAEPDYYVRQFYDFSSPPGDTFYPLQWGLPAFDIPDLWAALPSDAPIYTVAVIDSGVCVNHTDLAGKLIAGYDFVDNDNNPDDQINGHGCGVSGVIAANIDNGAGIAGVAPNVQIMPLRVLGNDGTGNHFNIASAIIYATDNGADVINLSLGGSASSTILHNAVKYADDNGVVVVAASGNLDLGAGERDEDIDVYYPARYPEVIAVGSVDDDLQKSDFSVSGPEIALMAPGGRIATTYPGNQYYQPNGTSF
ncbi:MAG: S8 family serine peptidase, partial [Aggregatilineales bacterium]